MRAFCIALVVLVLAVGSSVLAQTAPSNAPGQPALVGPGTGQPNTVKIDVPPGTPGDTAPLPAPAGVAPVLPTTPQTNVPAAGNTPAGSVGTSDSWRYVQQDGMWWYYQPNNQWLYWANGQWNNYVPPDSANAMTYNQGGATYAYPRTYSYSRRPRVRIGIGIGGFGGYGLGGYGLGGFGFGPRIGIGVF
jgi:hypothetical protein